MQNCDLSLKKQTSSDLLKKKIEGMKEISLQLEPTQEDFENQLSQVTEYSQNFLKDLKNQKVKQEPSARNIEENLQEKLKITNETDSFEEILSTFDNTIVKQGYQIGHPGFMGYFSGGGMQSAALGDMLSSLVNPFTSMKQLSPGAFQIEKILIEWSASVIGYPQNCGGNFTTGGSSSHLSAICSARDALQIKAKDYEKCTVYVTNQTHLSFKKSLNVAGMRECEVRIIDIDDKNYKMDTNKLEIQIKRDIENDMKPFMVVGSAGATSTGQIDPLDQIGKICQELDVWFHVDGAYGGFFALCDEGKKKLKGIELSDSIILDPHKTLSMPFGLGLVLVKNLQSLKKTFGSDKAYYLQDSTNDDEDEEYPEARELSNELSRNFRSLKLWMCLKLYGIKAFQGNLEEKLLLAKYFAKRVRQIPNIQVVMNPDLSVVCFRYKSDKVTKKEEINKINSQLNEKIQEDGEILLSSTVLDGYVTLRIAILSFRTHIEQVDTCLNNLLNSVSAINDSL